MTHGITLSDLPVVGPWARKIGKVGQIMAIPCSPTPEIWVEAFAVGELKMIWSFVAPMPLVDVIQEGGPLPRILNKGLAGQPSLPHTGRRGGKSSGGTLMDPWKAGPTGKWGIWVFRLGELALKIGWYFFIIDAGVDLALNTVTLAYQWSGCLPTPGDYCVLGNSPLDVVTPGSGWQPVLFGFAAGNIIYDGVDGILVPRSGGSFGGLAVTAKKWPTVPDQPGAPEFAIQSPDGSFYSQMEPQTVNQFPPGDSVSGGGLFRHNGPLQSGVDKFRLLVRNQTGYSELSGAGGSMTVEGTNPGITLFDPFHVPL